jgi:hypothetical protein
MVDMEVGPIYDVAYLRLSSRCTARMGDDLDRAARRKSVTSQERPGRTASERALGEAWRRVPRHKGLPHASGEGEADERCP